MHRFAVKQNCRTCDQVLAELENIGERLFENSRNQMAIISGIRPYMKLPLFSADDECDLYGIQMVKLQDPQLAKRYGIKTFPSLVYFRNGNPLTYDGESKFVTDS